MRCDLHIHSTASGRCNTPGLSRLCLESYNDPGQIYKRLKRLGMSAVTVTDHDSIDAVEALLPVPLHTDGVIELLNQASKATSNQQNLADQLNSTVK